MPLEPGSTKAVISHNIHEMEASGHPHRVAVAAALHNAHYKRKGKLDTNAAAHDAGHPDHDELRERKMALAQHRVQRDRAAEAFAADRMPRMGSHGPEARVGRPMAMGSHEHNDEYP